ncbi:hypothetical protein BU17DRAFT_63909 [Hysterangium stoloniferum]|nr:hypothetical protein BU17DRAFT_63909 [Hysterangium stoloniferum]
MSINPNVTLEAIQQTFLSTAADYVTLDPVTWIKYLSPSYPLFFLAYLAQKPGTYTLRVLVLHVLVLTVYQSMNSFVFVGERHLMPKLNCNMYGVYTLTKGIDITFHAQDYRKLPKKLKKGDGFSKSDGKLNVPTTLYQRVEALVFPIRETIEVLSTTRGIGLHFGKEVPIAPETRPLDKFEFLRSTIRKVVRAYIIADLLSTFWGGTALHRARAGGSIYLSNLSWPARHIVAILYNLSMGTMVIAFGEMGYYSATIQAVLLLSDPPEAWPLLFDRPFAAESLHDFWGRRWHQCLYRILKVYGGTPGGYLAERIGVSKKLGELFGTFFVTGLVHELPFVAAGYPLGWRLMAFFMVQGVLMVMERMWRNVTGKRVGGRPGNIWMFCTFMVLGTPLFTEAYAMRGVGSAIHIPRIFSVTQQILVPVWNFLASRSTILPRLSCA